MKMYLHKSERQPKVRLVVLASTVIDARSNLISLVHRSSTDRPLLITRPTEYVCSNGKENLLRRDACVFHATLGIYALRSESERGSSENVFDSSVTLPIIVTHG